jgi:N-methylhydantoinase A
LEIDEVAAGIIEVVDTHMERALRAVSVEEGVDPRNSVLVAFGGAGGLHATRLARRLGMTRTLIPPLSGVFSALGLLLASPSSDASRTVMLVEGSTRLASVTEEILDEAVRTYRSDHGSDPSSRRAWAEVRYAGQSHELPVRLVSDWARLRQEFEDVHQARFGFARAGEAIELVDVRAEVIGRSPITWADLPPIRASAAPMAPKRGQQVPVYSRVALAPGNEIEGPAVVIERDSAVWLELGDRMSVHVDGTLDVAS